MDYWYDDEPMWEPSEADELFGEIKSKLIDAAKRSIKTDMESLQSEVEYLRKRNKELEEKAHGVEQKEYALKCKADNLRREVENEFYNTAIDELFKERIENIDVWFADHKPHMLPKCNMCNDDRRLEHTFEDGQTISSPCSCNKQIWRYEPEIATLKVLKYSVRPSEYRSKRKYYLHDSKAYKQSTYVDDSYIDFRILNICDVFDDNTIKLHENRSYSEYLGFKTKEECQAYCDWLNKKE